MQTLETPSHLGAQRLFILIAALWVGSLLTVGYLVAPAIFSTMTDRQAAGRTGPDAGPERRPQAAGIRSRQVPDAVLTITTGE